MSGIVLNTGDTAVDKMGETFYLYEAYILVDINFTKSYLPHIHVCLCHLI